MNFIENILGYFRCVDCKGKLTIKNSNCLRCDDCGRLYNIEGGIVSMLPKEMLSEKRENIDKFSEMKLRNSQAKNYFAKTPILYSKLLDKLILQYLNIRNGDKTKKFLLDLGCGPGRIEHLLHDKYKMVFAVDFSKESLKIIDERAYKNVLLIQADVNKLPFTEEVFDDVCMVEFIQHIPSFCLREKLLLDVKNISKKGAKIILTSYNYNEKKTKQKLIYKKSESVLGEWGKTGYHAKSIYYYNYHYSELIPLVNQFFEIKNYFGFLLDFPLYIKIIRKLLRSMGADLNKFEAKWYSTGKDLKWGCRLFVSAVNEK